MLERYEAYKDSGVEWIGEVPSSWSCLKFRWVLNKVSRTPLEDDGVITCFRDGEVTLRSNRREDGFTMSDKEIGYQHICRGDFVIHGMDGFAGAMGISDSDGKASPVLMVFEPKRDTDLRYINYLLRFYAWQDVFLSLSTTIRVRSCDLNWNKVAPIPLVVPAPNEQKAIADYLDAKTAEIDDIVSETERSIELLREYRKSVISEAVTKGLDPDAPMKDSGIEWIGEIPEGWILTKLKYCLAEELLYGATEAGCEFNPNYPRYIRITDIDENGRLKSIGAKSLEPGKARPFILSDGDILFARSGATVGKSFLYKRDYGAASFAGYLIRARVNKSRLLPEFLELWTQSGCYESWKESIFNKATIQNIGADKYATLSVPLCDLEEQHKIISYLDAKTAEIDALIADKEKQVELLKEYRKSLISEAVTGKFKVPGVS